MLSIPTSKLLRMGLATWTHIIGLLDKGKLCLGLHIRLQWNAIGCEREELSRH